MPTAKHICNSKSWYNHKRRFSALNNLTIDEFRELYEIKNKIIKNVA